MSIWRVWPGVPDTTKPPIKTLSPPVVTPRVEMFARRVGVVVNVSVAGSLVAVAALLVIATVYVPTRVASTFVRLSSALVAPAIGAPFKSHWYARGGAPAASTLNNTPERGA